MFPKSLFPAQLYPVSLFPKIGGSGTPLPPASGYLGRFQQGQFVNLSFIPVDSSGFPVKPDKTPTVSVTDPLSNLVFTKKISMYGDAYHYLLKLFLDFSFTVLGRYTIEYTYFVSNEENTFDGTFDLVGGGDGAGSIISLISYARPEAVYIVAQTTSGRLMQGKNPQLY